MQSNFIVQAFNAVKCWPYILHSQQFAMRKISVATLWGLNLREKEQEAGRLVLRLWLQRWWDGGGFKGIFRNGIRRSHCHPPVPYTPGGTEPSVQQALR